MARVPSSTTVPVITVLLVIMFFTPTPAAPGTALLVALHLIRTLLLPITVLLVITFLPPTPPAAITPLLVTLRSTPTPPVPITPLLAALRSLTTPPPPTQWQWGIKPPLAPPHTTTKEAHISGIRQDFPQARALTTTPFSGIRQDTALPQERITL